MQKIKNYIVLNFVFLLLFGLYLSYLGLVNANPVSNNKIAFTGALLLAFNFVFTANILKHLKNLNQKG